jgi:hypothetical protein
MKITNIKLVLRRSYASSIKISFTPVEVYGNKYGYQKLNRAIDSKLRQYKRIIESVDTIRGRKGFVDKGIEVHFKMNSPVQQMKRLCTKIRKLKRTTFTDQRDF